MRERNSDIPFVDASDVVVVDPVPGVRVLRTSPARWSDVYAEIGVSREWSPDDLRIDRGDYLAVNLSLQPLSFESRTVAGFRQFTLRPGRVWVQAAGVPMHVRYGAATYGGIVIDSEYKRRYFGEEREFVTRVVTDDVVLAATSGALLAEITDGNDDRRDAIVSGLLEHLAQNYAVRRRSPRMASFGTRELGIVQDIVEAHLGEALPIARLAEAVACSPYHFARAFRAACGTTPHAYVVERRIARARQLIDSGRSGAAVANACGFTDHAHLARTLKRAGGQTLTDLRQHRAAVDDENGA